MAQAYRDENDVPTLIASSNVDGRTPVRLYADPVTHRLLVDGTGGGGGGVSLLPATGTVNGSNKLFTFTATPIVIVVDGIALEQVASDGTVNWTGTTSVTLTNAPNFDIFGLGASGGGGGSITVTDGVTTVSSVTEIDFTAGATVSDLGGGIAGISVSGGGGTQAYEGPLTITGLTTATVHYVPIWITINGLTYVLNNGWTRSGQTVTFDGDITGATIINFHNGTAIPSGSTTYEVPSGTVNGSNTSFTFASAPSVIVIDGISYQKVSSDSTVNWTGTTTVSLTIAPNSDIFGFDNSDASFQQPSGTVNGSNTSFVFSTAPNIISVDGITMNKVSSDGTVNWTGTTTVSLTIAPIFDIFAYGGLADFQVPTGTVNGSNTSFTYSTAPNVIVVDGVEKRKTSADSTVNWTGTTSITLSVAPNFNIVTP